MHLNAPRAFLFLPSIPTHSSNLLFGLRLSHPIQSRTRKTFPIWVRIRSPKLSTNPIFPSIFSIGRNLSRIWYWNCPSPTPTPNQPNPSFPNCFNWCLTISNHLNPRFIPWVKWRLSRMNELIWPPILFPKILVKPITPACQAWVAFKSIFYQSRIS